MRVKKIIYLVVLLVCQYTVAQNKQLLYDFTEIPQALLLNPGMEVSYQWYAGIPALSGVSFQFGSSGVTVHNLFADDGVDFNTKIREKVIYGMDIKDELSGAFQLDILNGGFRSKNNPNTFYSFGVYLEADAIGYWFKDLAILAFEGNADNLNREFDISHLKVRGEANSVFHFGINKRVKKDLTVGVRGKLYSNILNFKTTKNDGYFVTREGEDNFFASTIDADLQLQSSGVQELLDDDTTVPSVVTKNALLGGSLGLGLDAGFTYNLNEQWVVTASVLDLGFVYQSKDIVNYNLEGNTTVEGIDIILPRDLIGLGSDFWQELVDEVEALVPFEETHESYISFRPTKLYSSLRYNFGERIPTPMKCNCEDIVSNRSLAYQYVNSTGLQLYAINRPRGPQAALTAFYQRRFGNSLSIKTTYTVDKFSFSNIGLGINLQAGPVNMYAMADNLLAYKNIADTHYASFQLGLNIISWGKK